MNNRDKLESYKGQLKRNDRALRDLINWFYINIVPYMGPVRKNYGFRSNKDWEKIVRRKWSIYDRRIRFENRVEDEVKKLHKEIMKEKKNG